MRLLFAGAKMYWRIFQPVNFGAQVMLIREEQVVLLRHTYKSGWYFPGGGVKRKENVAGAFSVLKPHRVRSKNLLLIDDVFTTGSTVDQCSRVLKRAGAARVEVLTLARAI